MYRVVIFFVMLASLKAGTLGGVVALEGSAHAASLTSPTLFEIGEHVDSDDVLISRDVNKTRYMFNKGVLIAPNPKGALLIQRRNAPHKLDINASLSAGDLLWTGDVSEVIIVFHEGSKLMLNAKSRVLISPMNCKGSDKIEIKLLQGSGTLEDAQGRRKALVLQSLTSL